MEVVCERLLKRIESDDYVRGYKEFHLIFGKVIEILNEKQETELMITGSTMEKGKVVWANDVGDLDILVFNKTQQYLIDVQQLQNVPTHPGFVRILQNGEFIPTKELKEKTPNRFVHMLMLQLSLTNGVVFKVVHDPNGPASKITILNNFQSLNEQWRNLGEISSNQIALIQNFIRVLMLFSFNGQNLSNEEIEKRIEEASSIMKNISKQKRQDVFELFDIFDQVLPAIKGMNNVKVKENKEGEVGTSKPMYGTSANAQLTDESIAANMKGKSIGGSLAPEQTNIRLKEESTPEQEQPQEIIPGEIEKETDVEEEELSGLQQVTIHDVIPKNGNEVDSTDSLGDEATANKPNYNGQKPEETKDKIESYIQDLVQREYIDAMTKKAEEMAPSPPTYNDNADFSREVGIDIVMAFKLDKWPPIATSFFDRADRLWPSGATVEKLKNSSVFVVVKHPENEFPEEQITYCFRYSFSHSEKIICQDMNEFQLKCHRLMKLFHKSVLTKTYDGQTTFSSYHVKTALFWVCEMNGEEIFEPENLEICMTLIISYLLTSVCERCLKHYFIEQVNLFQYFSDEEFDELEIALTVAIADLTEAFESVESEFIATSDSVQANVDAISGSAAEPPEEKNTEPGDCYLTLHDRWSETYDRMTTRLAQEVHDPTCDHQEDAQFPIELKQLFRKSKMSYESMLSTFSTVKPNIYLNHALKPSDAKRPIKQVVMEDITRIRSLLKYVLKISNINEVASSEEAFNQQMWHDMQNSDQDLTNYIQGSIPDGNELINAFHLM